LTLFGCMLPIECVLRIWDWFLAWGWPVVIKIGLAILKHSQGK
jgi:hypothetical protein